MNLLLNLKTNNVARSIIILDENSEQVEMPHTFKKPLYEYQKAAIQRILNIAYNRTYKENQRVIMTSACVYTDPFGSGKTPALLGLISHTPRPKPFYTNCYNGNVPNADHNYFVKKYNKSIKPSIIFVGNSVLNQWAERIKEFTDLKVFVLSDVYKLETFYKEFQSLKINNYDIILIKNGKVSNSFVLPNEIKANLHSIRTIHEVVYKIMNGTSCSWLIYDDFDSINLASGPILNSMFTIFVSATGNRAAPILRQPESPANTTLVDKLKITLNPDINYVLQDDNLYMFFNVINDANFINNSINLPIFKVFDCTYRHPNDKYIGLIGAMGTETSLNIMSAINSGSINTAAHELGVIAEPDPCSIFQKLLDAEWDKYELSCMILDVIARLKKIDDLEERYDARENVKEHSESELTEIQRLIVVQAKRNKSKNSRDPKDLKLEPETEVEIEKDTNDTNAKSPYHKILGYQSDRLLPFLIEQEIHYLKEKDHNSKIINRVKENLQEGECPVCCGEYDDIIITKCCNTTICGKCFQRGFQIVRNENHRDKTVKITGVCTQCLKQLDLAADIVYITRGFDLNSMLSFTKIDIEEQERQAKLKLEEERKLREQSKLEEEQKPVIVLTPEEQELKEFLEESDPKLQALYKIILGQEPADRKERENYSISSLITGTKDIPFGTGEVGPRKVLVYAGFNESLSMIQDFLKRVGVDCLRLLGKANQMHEALRDFRNADRTTVMLVNSSQNCAGMDIQFCHDLVFYHKLLNASIEGQVCGRAQRIGRKYNFNIYYLLYKNEEKFM